MGARGLLQRHGPLARQPRERRAHRGRSHSAGVRGRIRGHMAHREAVLVVFVVAAKHIVVAAVGTCFIEVIKLKLVLVALTGIVIIC